MTESVDGCRHLWCSILERIFSDACHSLNGPESEADRLTCQRARDWLFTDSSDFERVCHFAGIEPDVVRGYAARLAAQGWYRTGISGHRRVLRKAAA